MNKTNARNLLRQFDFKGLFLNELGWNDHTGKLRLKVGDKTVTLEAIAEKRGMAAYLCPAAGPDNFFDYHTRCRIETQLAKSVREHLIIFVDTDRRFQTWQWVKRELARPIARREHSYSAGQASESLLQKLEALEVKLADEDQLTLVGVAGMVRSAFDVDRVTRRFYDQFKTEHAAFLKLIDGIEEDRDREWYASIILNRLQFIYFIQKKGFLDQDKDFLRNRLAMVKKTRPKTKFLSFYRAFLLKLFHDGLGRKERNSELLQLLGTVPYLNGGIFAVHPLEEKYVDIDIPDKAFEKIFNFFDQYSWHLDERPLRSYDEINPDVLGYIFEKYINQKQMGAYYTKEDITEYIAKNCIIPFIFDRTEVELKKKGKESDFRSLFQLLSADPERYIYDPVKHGITLPLPPDIEKGVDTKKANLLDRRAGWNKPAPSEHALPAETWREVVARRQRHAEIRSTLGTRSSRLSINDLITLNLNIRQFAQDCIENAAGPDILWAFWKAIDEITILDPTCGSGAFLFAAVNILEPLYEACLDRMKAFMLEWSRGQRVPHPSFYRDFAAVIARVDKHANEKYFIFKSIIIRNLYGVDIMDEAVEICKLRLFLKLAAQVEPNYDEDNLGIEPLPDIDFNIKAGNTLVGFATEKQAEDVIRQDLLAYKTVWPEVQRDALEVNELFKRFRLQQTELGGAVGIKDKAVLREKLAPLERRLNEYLAGTYGVTGNKAFKDWVLSHKPFHWFIDFYEIMHDRGFDVIIGNPPYLERSKLGSAYSVRGFKTQACSDIYSWIMERTLHLRQSAGRLGLIVPVSLASSGSFNVLRDILHSQSCFLWLSHFANRPGQLFVGAQNRLTIVLSAAGSNPQMTYSTRYHRWDARGGEREALFASLRYCALGDLSRGFNGLFPKVGNPENVSILRKILGNRSLGYSLQKQSKFSIVWVRVPGYFCQFFLDPPKVRPEKGGPSRPRGEILAIHAEGPLSQRIIHSSLNSSIYFIFYLSYSDGRHINPSDVTGFPLDLRRFDVIPKEQMMAISHRLEVSMKESTSRWRKSGLLIDSVDSRHTKPLLDEADRVLARHYGFTDEELDFIINYDIKYRMGRDNAEEE